VSPVLISSLGWRGKTYSSLGGRKAYLNFELKDAPKARRLRRSKILDFKVQIRSGRPRDEWEGAAWAADFFYQDTARPSRQPFGLLFSRPVP
jgi:hypothetical protein